MISVSKIKEQLNITDDTYDAFLKEQEAVISESIEGYCGRKFLLASYTQTFYKKDYDAGVQELSLFHYPMVSVDTIVQADKDGDILDITDDDVILQYPKGLLYYRPGFFSRGDRLAVSYSAGFEKVPAPVRNVFYAIIEERYNKKISNVALNFGSDVQRISIPGTISIDFDYSLQANERKTAYGTILGNYVNILDSYRSERTIIGSGVISYVD